MDFVALAGGPAGPDRGPAAVAADALISLRYLVLGYDIDEREARPLLAALATARAQLPPDDPGVLAGEMAVMAIFADLASLSRNRRGPEDATADGDPADEEARNPQEYLYAYLRSRDADAEGLPESFRGRLRRALAHYGVPDLAPSDERRGDQLNRALYRMFLAHRRAVAHVPVLLELLQWRLRNPDSLPASARDAYLAAVDQLVRATQLRHPVVGGLARRVRYALLRRPADRGRAGTRPAARPGRAGAARRGARPGRTGGPDRRHRGRRGADPRGVRAAAPRRDARGDDPALLPHPDPARAAGDRAAGAPGAHRRLHRRGPSVHRRGHDGAHRRGDRRQRPDRRAG